MNASESQENSTIGYFRWLKQQREVAENLEARTEGIFLASYLKPRKKKCIGLFRVVQKIQTRP